MHQYLNLVSEILNRGQKSPDRTGTGTYSVFGHQMRFDLNEGFPLVTTKKTFWKGAFVEMLWMLRGDTNIGWLHEHGVHIWDEWATPEGELGPIYGSQWRQWNVENGRPNDQLRDLIDGLKNRPHSRRHIMSAWNVWSLPDERYDPQTNVNEGLMALAPCHCLVQFYVRDGKLSCQLYQRSADVFLGVPFNIAGYTLLTYLLAHHLGYGVGEFIWTGGDCHLYLNHTEQARELLTRTPRPLPHLSMSHAADAPLWEVEPADLEILAYHPHPTIKAPVSV